MEQFPYRRLAQAVEWSLLAIVALLHLAGWFWNGSLAAAVPFGQLLADSWPLASLLVLACWCVLGPGPAWISRSAATVFLLFVVTAMVSKDLFSRAYSDALLVFAPLATFAAAVVLRMCGLKVRAVPLQRTQPGATFTVRGLMAITTAVAIVVGGLEAARPWFRQPPSQFESDLELLLASTAAPPPARLTLRVPAAAPFKAIQARINEAHRKGQFRFALATVLLAAAALLSYAAVLRPGTVWLRLGGLAAVVPAAGWYIGHLTDTDSESTITLTVWAATTTAIILGSLVPLRLMGYRLLRPQPPPAEVQP